jgi:hypothetical protein
MTVKNGICFPAANYQRFNNESSPQHLSKRSLIQEVLKAYDSLRSYSNKADLGRFCLLYATLAAGTLIWAFA